MQPLNSIESRIAMLIAQDYCNTAITKELYISLRSVNNHIKSIKLKWQIQSRVEIAILVYHYQKLDKGFNLEGD